MQQDTELVRNGRSRMLDAGLISREVARTRKTIGREVRAIVGSFVSELVTRGAIVSGSEQKPNLESCTIPPRFPARKNRRHPSGWHRSFVQCEERAKADWVGQNIHREILQADRCQAWKLNRMKRRQAINELREEMKLAQIEAAAKVREGRRRQLLEKIGNCDERARSLVGVKESLLNLRQEIVRNSRIYKDHVKGVLAREWTKPRPFGGSRAAAYSSFAESRDMSLPQEGGERRRILRVSRYDSKKAEVCGKLSMYTQLLLRRPVAS